MRRECAPDSTLDPPASLRAVNAVAAFASTAWLLFASGTAHADAAFELQFPPPQGAALPVPVPPEILQDQSLIFVSEEHAKLIA